MCPRKSLSPEKRVGYKGKKIPVFCQRVASKRKELGLKQEELAEIIGTKGPRISEIEAGSLPRDEDRIIAIARALKVDINWLFGFTSE